MQGHKAQRAPAGYDEEILRSIDTISVYHKCEGQNPRTIVVRDVAAQRKYAELALILQQKQEDIACGGPLRIEHTPIPGEWSIDAGQGFTNDVWVRIPVNALCLAKSVQKVRYVKRRRASLVTSGTKFDDILQGLCVVYDEPKSFAYLLSYKVCHSSTGNDKSRTYSAARYQLKVC